MSEDDKRYAQTPLRIIRQAGLTVSVTQDRLGTYHLSVTDDGHQYELSGDRLYPLALELAKQLDFEDLD